MSSWLVRSIGMALLHAVALLALAKIEFQQPSEMDLIRSGVIAILVAAAALWAAIDGWLRRPARNRDWFVAALIAGPVSGVLGVIGRSAFIDQTGIVDLRPALTGGAAFTALLVLLPAGLGLFVGSRIAPAHRSNVDLDEQSTVDEDNPDEDPVPDAPGAADEPPRESVAQSRARYGLRRPARARPSPRPEVDQPSDDPAG